MTFVSEENAKLGFAFYFHEIHSECPKTCQLFTTCQGNVAPHKVYEVVEVLKRKLDCVKGFHEEPMVLVRIQEPEIFVSMYNRDIYEGSIVKFSPIHCDHEECPHIDHCDPNSLLVQATQKVKIVQVVEKIKKCPRELALSVIKLEKK